MTACLHDGITLDDAIPLRQGDNNQQELVVEDVM